MCNFLTFLYYFLSLSGLMLSAIGDTAPLPSLQPVKGTKYADQWKGSFKVINCIICEDLKLPSGANLKNLVEFGLDFASVMQAELPQCATSDLAVSQYFQISSDDGTVSNILGKSYGLCSWSSTKNYQFLDLSDEYFHYRSQIRNPKNTVLMEESFTIDKLENGKYLVHRIVNNPNPSGGLPKKHVYFFEAEKNYVKARSDFRANSIAHTSENVFVHSKNVLNK